MSRVELCLASPSFLPLVGGGQTRFARYAPGLKERGISIEIFSGTPKAKKMPGEDAREAWRETRPGARLPSTYLGDVPVHRIRTQDRGPLRTHTFGRGLVAHCRSAVPRPEVLQWVAGLRPGFAPWLRKLRSGGMRTLYALTIAPRPRNSRLRQAWEAARLRHLYREFDCIVANAESGRSLLRDLGVMGRIEVIPNGVDLDRFRPVAGPEERRAVRASLGLAPERRVIVAVGTVSPRKGSDLLLEAWSKLAHARSDLDLVFVGTRKDHMHEELGGFQRRIEHLLVASGAQERVHFTGYVSHVEAYLRAADVCVLASDREGSPNSILEAMATQIPVLATPFHGISTEIGVPGRQFALCDRNPEALALNLERLLHGSRFASELAAAGHGFVIREMSLARSLDAFANLYREYAKRG